jgi:hypothetical protein
MAKDSRHCKDFVAIDANTFPDDADLSDEALKLLTRGKIVIVKKYPMRIKSQAIFDLEYLERQLKLTPKQEVMVQGGRIYKFRRIYLIISINFRCWATRRILEYSLRNLVWKSTCG